jgi:hypothetical protein
MESQNGPSFGKDINQVAIAQSNILFLLMKLKELGTLTSCVSKQQIMRKPKLLIPPI